MVKMSCNNVLWDIYMGLCVCAPLWATPLLKNNKSPTILYIASFLKMLSDLLRQLGTAFLDVTQIGVL